MIYISGEIVAKSLDDVISQVLLKINGEKIFPRKHTIVFKNFENISIYIKNDIQVNLRHSKIKFLDMIIYQFVGADPVSILASLENKEQIQYVNEIAEIFNLSELKYSIEISDQEETFDDLLITNMID